MEQIARNLVDAVDGFLLGKRCVLTDRDPLHTEGFREILKNRGVKVLRLLLRRTFGFELVCQKCKSPLRLIALVKNQDIAKKILTAMHLPAEAPQLHPARPPPRETAGGGDDWLD